MAQSWMLNQKGNKPKNHPDLVKIAPDTPAIEAIKPMSHTNSSCVVVETAQLLVGIFTKRDLVKAIANGVKIENMAIAELITPNPIAIAASAAEDIFLVLQQFQQHQVLHLPVVNQSGEVISVLTPSAILQVLDMYPLIATLQHQLQQQITRS
jgi:CBS domain-containing protein